MICNFSELRNKEVINKIDGARLGTICDFEVDTQSGQMASLLILGKGRLFSALTETIKINWEDIKVIGEDTVLVTYRKDTYSSAKRGKSPVITTINIPRSIEKKELTEEDFSEFE
ncbi:MAG: YlmC/YmxH family sporulation protein [Clostridia bacterium]|nr:YlmC/YmxH family sporulation protein [Clostridia bacterium]